MRTELARSVRKDRGLNILQYEKRTRLIISLLYATAYFADNLPNILGIYRKFAEKCSVQEYEVKVFFMVFWQFSIIPKNFQSISENFRHILVQVFPEYRFRCTFAFAESLSERLN